MVFTLKSSLMFFFLFTSNCNGENPQKVDIVVEKSPLPKNTIPQPVSPDPIDHLKYSWKDEIAPDQVLQARIKTPDLFQRIDVEKGSFADWLRHLPLKADHSKVYLYNGALKTNQSVHAAVVDIDVGTKDLQQCADAVMRLRSEYFYGKEAYSKIHFNYTSGDKVAFEDWMRGKKPVVKGNTVHFSNGTNTIDHSYTNFQKYLIAVFNYAGTASLSKELQKVAVEDMEIGDVFIQGGFPGHAVIVVDMAINESGKKCFLLAQSYMPAQEIHVLKNFNDPHLNNWYSTDFGEILETPEWTFSRSDLKRFKD